ncbi:MAG: signal peptidase II [Lachnospiraceae bacterium]|nr:signal peptidase II [Lachnospiraceae bacterium]
MKKNVLVSVITGILFVAALVGIDQWSKYLAAVYLKNQPNYVIWKNVFELEYLENRGAAFGMLQGKRILFLVITVLFILVICRLYLRIPAGKRYRWLRGSFLFLLAGAVGNMIDRIRLDYVIDFFSFTLIHFPIFNVADIYVSVTCVILFVLILFYYREDELSRIFFKKGNRSK